MEEKNGKTCLKCSFQWTPKVAEPKCCPSCKSYRWDEPPRRAGRRKKGESTIAAAA